MPTPSVRAVRHMKSVGVLADVNSGHFGHEFLQFNLIYGFNGCGKTTLSRLFESISDAGMSPNLPDAAEFSFSLGDGTAPSNTTETNSISRHLMVFNEDYVERSLTWKEGSARPIIYIGKEQGEIAGKLETAESNARELQQKETQLAGEWSASNRALGNFCTNIARLIAEEIGQARRYNAANLRTDYASLELSPSDKINEAGRRSLKEVILRSEVPPKIEKFQLAVEATGLARSVQELVRRSVVDVAITSLQRRKDALAWVAEGLQLHEREQECLFCGNILMGPRVADLKSALGSGFAQLSSDIDDALEVTDGYREV